MHTFLGSGMHASMHGMHPVEDSDMRQRAPKTNLPLIDFAICHRVYFMLWAKVIFLDST
jgi:hypothetical protein